MQKGHRPDHRKEDEARCHGAHGSDLLQLDQSAIEILGMQKDHRFAMCADFRLSGAEDTGASGSLRWSRAAMISSTS